MAGGEGRTGHATRTSPEDATSCPPLQRVASSAPSFSVLREQLSLQMEKGLRVGQVRRACLWLGCGRPIPTRGVSPGTCYLTGKSGGRAWRSQAAEHPGLLARGLQMTLVLSGVIAISYPHEYSAPLACNHLPSVSSPDFSFSLQGHAT